MGLSAASVFLNAYRTPLFLIGIGMNVVGVVVITRQLLRAQQACAMVVSSPSAGGLATRQAARPGERRSRQQVAEDLETSEVSRTAHLRLRRVDHPRAMDTRRQLRIPIYGLGCGAAEAMTVERVLAGTDGVLSAYVNPATETACVDYDPAETDQRTLERVIERAGYQVGCRAEA